MLIFGAQVLEVDKSKVQIRLAKTGKFISSDEEFSAVIEKDADAMGILRLIASEKGLLMLGGTKLAFPPGLVKFVFENFCFQGRQWCFQSSGKRRRGNARGVLCSNAVKNSSGSLSMFWFRFFFF